MREKAPSKVQFFARVLLFRGFRDDVAIFFICAIIFRPCSAVGAAAAKVAARILGGETLHSLIFWIFVFFILAEPN